MYYIMRALFIPFMCDNHFSRQFQLSLFGCKTAYEITSCNRRNSHDNPRND